MKNAIYLLLQYGYHLLFFAIEFLCFYLIVNYNQEQKEIFINSTNLFTTKINNRVDQVESYLKLKDMNDSLQLQNARLIEKLINSDINVNKNLLDTITIDSFQYQLIPASICNSTVHLKNNFITLCIGENQGVKKDMGVISEKGIVGIINRTTKNYSNLMSILNKQINISCTIKRKNANGILVWKGNDPSMMNLEAIPKHISVLEGDTIVTSGFSTMFPKGILVGKIEHVVLEKGSNNYTIDVRLFNDPVSLDVVYVINNKKAEEQKLLEQEN